MSTDAPETSAPPELAGINWAAVLLGGLWAGFHGLWGWAAAFLAVWGLGELLPLASGYFSPPIGVQLSVAVVYTIGYWALGVWFGSVANRAYWIGPRNRDSTFAVKRPLPDYLRNQRLWATVGLLLVVTDQLDGRFSSADVPRSVAVVSALTAALFLLAAWLWARRNSGTPLPDSGA